MRLETLGIAFLLLTAPLMLFAAAADVVEAKQGTPDGGGYKYTDGLDPEPTIEADYYDVKMDPNAEGLDTSNYNSLIKRDLGFNFNYYGNSYSSVYISTYGAMSFTENNANAFQNYNNYRIPSTNAPSGLMAVYWTWDNCYTRDKDRLYILRTEIDGEKVFMVEWNTGGGAKYEAFLYEGGMIKYQYFSGSQWYQLGSYCTIGIESPNGNTGVPYIDYQYTNTPKFNAPFAVAFTKDNMDIKKISLDNGHDSGDQIYAGSRPYVFSVNIYHSTDADSVLSCVLTLGSLFNQERVSMIYYHKNRTFSQLNGEKHIALLAEESGSEKLSNNDLSIKFHVDFMIEYPSEERRNVSARASGMSAIPSVRDGGELYKVENDIQWDPLSLRVKKVSGEPQNLKDGDYIGGGQSIMFTSFRMYYERSDVQPPPTIVSLNISDNFGLKKVAYIPQGEFLSTTWTVVDQTAIMTFEFEVAGLTFRNLLSDPFSFTLKVDTNPPSEIEAQSVKIYQDELHGSTDPYNEETDTYYDNDDSFYLEWDKITDGESGIGGYFVEVKNTEFYLKKFVPSTDDGSSNISVLIGDSDPYTIPEGEFDISIKARDLVGNTGPAVTKKLVNDRSGLDFTLIDPVPGEWLMSKRPTVRIAVSDELSPVDGRTLFYQVSNNGGITFSDLSRMDYLGQSQKYIEIDLRPDLVEGRSNMLRVQGEDIAGSGLTISEEFPLWVDQRTPEISLIDPVVDENLTTVEWIKDVSEPVRIAIHDWKGSGVDPTRMSYRISVNGGTTFSANIPLDGIPVNNSKGFAEYTFSITKDWQEGTDNLLVVDAWDLVGRNSTKVFRIRVDVTPELEVLSPGVNEDHYDNQTVTFRVAVTDLDGDEDIVVVWMSNLDGPIGFLPEISSLLSAGDHIITLTVEDGVHTIKRSIPLTVMSSRVLDPAFRDSDSDGMNDSYEEQYGLDPFVDDADGDLDEDGHTNIEEYYANTDPTLAVDRPGGKLATSSIDTTAIVVLVIGVLLLVVFGILFIRESGKQQQIPQGQMPPIPLQQTGIQQNVPQQTQLPALPPARNQ